MLSSLRSVHVSLPPCPRPPQKEFGTFIVRDQRSLLQVLEAFPSTQPPIDVLLELLPKLQPRYYSISSSPKKHPDSIHVTAAVVDYETKIGVQMGGVCTSWLAAMTAGAASVPIFVRQSTFRLPSKDSLGVVMIGPGTGLAPFRGFIQDRDAQREKGTCPATAAAGMPSRSRSWPGGAALARVCLLRAAHTPFGAGRLACLAGKQLGETVLFFGAQKEKENFLYEDELKGYLQSKTLTGLHTAFSRDGNKKVYVQHKLAEQGEHVHKILKAGGYFYVCGDATKMAKDVQHALVKIGQEHGNRTEQQSIEWVKDLRLRKRYSEDVWS